MKEQLEFPTLMPAPTFDPGKTDEAAATKQRKQSRAQQAKRSAPGSIAMPTGPAEPMDPPFEVYFEPGKRAGFYYYQDQTGKWNPHTLEDFRRQLRMYHIDGRSQPGVVASDHDRMITKVQKCHAIDYAGPVPGRRAGLKFDHGQRILVTSSPDLPFPKYGDFSTLNNFLSELFGVGQDEYGETQRLVFDLWLERAWIAMQTGDLALGHALILAGPAKCGKNLLQEVIITKCLGNRPVKAGDYLLGRSEFSGYIFSGDHLILSDEQAARDLRSRRDFGQRIKSVVANSVHSMHPKGRDPISMEARWSLTISVNDEPEHLQTLPPVADEDIRDKVHLLRCWPASIPADEAAKRDWVETLKSQIPQYLNHALQLKPTAKLAEQGGIRFGHTAFHHPELLQRLNSFSPEMHLLQLIDQWLQLSTPWTGSASDLRAALLSAVSSNPVFQREVGDLLKTEEMTGRYLQRLANHHPERVSALPRTTSKRGWQILPARSESTV